MEIQHRKKSEEDLKLETRKSQNNIVLLMKQEKNKEPRTLKSSCQSDILPEPLL